MPPERNMPLKGKGIGRKKSTRRKYAAGREKAPAGNKPAEGNKPLEGNKPHRKKKFASFPSPAGMSLPNSSWAGIMTS